jgi:hypothetical protein
VNHAMDQLNHSVAFTVPAPPERVFPLLCPVMEYRWIPTWRCELLHSASGVAEEDCVFRTDFPGAGPMTWVVTRYQPTRHIAFCCFVPDCFVMRLELALVPDSGGTRLTWTRRWLSLGPKGDAWLAAQTAAGLDRMIETRRTELVHYLATGEMLKA